MIYLKYKKKGREISGSSPRPRREAIEVKDHREESLLKKKRRKLGREEKEYLKRRLGEHLKTQRTQTTNFLRCGTEVKQLRVKKEASEKTYSSLMSQILRCSDLIKMGKEEVEGIDKRKLQTQEKFYSCALNLDKYVNNLNLYETVTSLLETKKKSLEEYRRGLIVKQTKCRGEIPFAQNEIEKISKRISRIESKNKRKLRILLKLIQKEYVVESEIQEIHRKVFTNSKAMVSLETQKGTLEMLMSMKDLLRDEYKKSIGTIEFNYDEEKKKVAALNEDVELLHTRSSTQLKDLYDFLNLFETEKFNLAKLFDDHSNLKSEIINISVVCNSIRKSLKKYGVMKSQLLDSKKLLQSEKVVLNQFLSKMKKVLEKDSVTIDKDQKILIERKNKIKELTAEQSVLQKRVEEKRKIYNDFVKTDATLKRQLESFKMSKNAISTQYKKDQNVLKLSQSKNETKTAKYAKMKSDLDTHKSELQKVEKDIKDIGLDSLSKNKNDLAKLKNSSGKRRFFIEKLEKQIKSVKRARNHSVVELEESKKEFVISADKLKVIVEKIEKVYLKIKENLTNLKTARQEFEASRRKQKNFSTRAIDKNQKDIMLNKNVITRIRERILKLKAKENVHLVQMEIKNIKIELLDFQIKNIDEYYNSKRSESLEVDKELVQLKEKFVELEKELNKERRTKKDELEKEKRRKYLAMSKTEKELQQKSFSLDTVLRSLNRNLILMENINRNKKQLHVEHGKVENRINVEKEDRLNLEREEKRLTLRKKKHVRDRNSTVLVSLKTDYEKKHENRRIIRVLEFENKHVSNEVTDISDNIRKVIHRIVSFNKKMTSNNLNIKKAKRQLTQTKKKISVIEKNRVNKTLEIENIQVNVSKSHENKIQDVEIEKKNQTEEYLDAEERRRELKSKLAFLKKRIAEIRKHLM